MQDNTEYWIDRSRLGDAEAFGRIVVRYQQMVYALCLRLLCNEADAEDMTQEAFVKAWRHIGRYRAQYKFSTWLYRIACNACYDKLRARRGRTYTALSECDLHAPAAPDEELQREQLTRLILGATEGLSPKQKLVFTLSDIEELEPEEIGVITGMTSAKIKSNLYLARKQIKSKLSHHE